MVQKLKSLRVDIIIILVILVAGLKFTFGLEKVLDISLYDESDYLYRGVTLWNAGLPPADLAPLYSIWLFILSFFEPNRVLLYFLNYKLMMIFPVIFVYCVLRKNTVSIPVSLTISLLLLISGVHIYIAFRVSYFALMMILAVFLFISHKGSLLINSFVASMGALVVSYIRPEYFLTYVLATLLFIYILIREHKNLEKRYLLRLFVVYGFLSLFLFGTLGIPVNGKRSIGAFAQHFSVNWVARTGSPINPWTSWWEIMAVNFGTADSIPEAFVANPSAFLLHITDNIRHLAPATAHLIFPVDLFLSRRIMILLIIGLLILYSFITREKRLAILVEYKQYWIFFGLFIFTELVAILLIYPENHYILLPGVLTTVLMLILLANHNVEEKQMGYKPLLLIGLLVVILIPTPYLRQQTEKTQTPHLNTIRFIRSLGINQSVNLLETAGGYDIYLGDNFHRVAEYGKSTGFNQFRAEQKINMIVVSDALLNDARFINDPEWQSFLTDYGQLGYLQKEIPDTNMHLILLADLIHE